MDCCLIWDVFARVWLYCGVSKRYEEGLMAKNIDRSALALSVLLHYGFKTQTTNKSFASNLSYSLPNHVDRNHQCSVETIIDYIASFATSTLSGSYLRYH